MAKRIYITEEQFRTIVKEMAYPSNFNMEELESLPSYAARVNYCKQRLKRLGAGSSRIVFAVDDEKVLKVAKNKKGVAQNLEEGARWKQNYYCFANVYDQSDDGIFLEMQAARPAKPSDFKRLTGYDFNTMIAWIYYTASLYSRDGRWRWEMYYRYNRDELEEFFNSDEWSDYIGDYNIFGGIHSYLCDAQLEAVGDFTRISSWGVVTENGEENLALIDFGLSDEVFNDYYRRRA